MSEFAADLLMRHGRVLLCEAQREVVDGKIRELTRLLSAHTATRATLRLRQLPARLHANVVLLTWRAVVRCNLWHMDACLIAEPLLQCCLSRLHIGSLVRNSTSDRAAAERTHVHVQA